LVFEIFNSLLKEAPHAMRFAAAAVFRKVIRLRNYRTCRFYLRGTSFNFKEPKLNANLRFR
jgi:hypothetical protein